ncbi:DUF4190 domain-containing protein [Mycobacterium branderi]|uniref:DUF4190 domain-containing protein n=1 Tax=Mycobacterium branderi TaxID=43348 RepID=A0A7I7W7G9_9MYCO|nr:DUF4190 domain-containing protein [Mycobacterium branderi]ORA35767.1 hypothetical protein BST20_17015 [Mycobacterium branderi]BBZ12822.1 hypothetical protein MBRA_30170 [Mycobacterium branderi]
MTVPGGEFGERAPDGPNQPPAYRPPGYPQGGYDGYPEQPGTNTLAIASLVASLVGLLCGVGSIVGIVLGTVAVNQIKQTRQQGYGLAVTGIVVGIGTLVVGIVFFMTVRLR